MSSSPPSNRESSVVLSKLKSAKLWVHIQDFEFDAVTDSNIVENGKNNNIVAEVCLCLANKPLIIVSGWSDGGVRRYHLDDMPIDSHENILLNPILENDFPRNIIFLTSLIMIVHMNSGQLWKIDQNNPSIFYDDQNRLINGYAKMNVAYDGNFYLAVGSLNGFILIFNHNGIIINEFQIEINQNKKILQILWLNDTLSSKLLVCIPNGIMVNV